MNNGEKHMHDPEFRFEKWLKEFHPEDFDRMYSSTMSEEAFEGGGSEQPHSHSKVPKQGKRIKRDLKRTSTEGHLKFDSEKNKPEVMSMQNQKNNLLSDKGTVKKKRLRKGGKESENQLDAESQMSKRMI